MPPGHKAASPNGMPEGTTQRRRLPLRLSLAERRLGRLTLGIEPCMLLALSFFEHDKLHCTLTFSTSVETVLKMKMQL